LQNALAEGLGERLRGHDIVLSHYTLYVNGHHAEVARSWGGAIGGAIGGGIGGNPQTHRTACGREAFPAGWFDPSELTTPYTPYVVEIEVALDGRPVTIHSVFSPPQNVSETSIISGRLMRQNEYEWANAAIVKANTALVAAVAAALPSTAK
jgi:hypothetical protein